MWDVQQGRLHNKIVAQQSSHHEAAGQQCTPGGCEAPRAVPVPSSDSKPLRATSTAAGPLSTRAALALQALTPMNFFHKNKPAAASSLDAQPAPAPELAPMAPTRDAPDPAQAPPQPEPPAPAEAPVAADKKPRFGRFNLQLPNFGRGGKSTAPASNSDPAEVSSAADALANAHIGAPGAPTAPAAPAAPVDPAKAARRAARRAERTKLEEEWAAEKYRRHKDSVFTGLPEEPLTPLPEFHSASEDEAERHEPDAVAGDVPPEAPLQQHDSAYPMPPGGHPAPAVTVVGEGMPKSPAGPMKGPFIPPSPAHSQDAPLTPQSAPGPFIPPQPAAAPRPAAALQLAAPSQLQPQRDPRADAQMAEMFGAQAYTGYQPRPTEVSATPSAPPMLDFLEHAQASAPPAGAFARVPSNPTPIGWGEVYSGFSSQPMYGTPAHLASGRRDPLDIEPALLERVRRGRELGFLAIEQETQGNLGAAENGYMKALELLIPASKELDAGSELNKNARMQLKAKIQREAAVMLDRCEELRVFLRANQTAVPKELPAEPVVNYASGRSKPASGKLPAPPAPPKLDSEPAPGMASSAATRRAQSPDIEPPRRPPPPAPPAFHDDSDDLLVRLASRKNALTGATVGPQQSKGTVPATHPPAAAPTPAAAQPPNAQPPPPLAIPKDPKGEFVVAKCFMCNASAEVRTKCSESFCQKCANQVVAVFENCPVPSCGREDCAGEYTRIP